MGAWGTGSFENDDALDWVWNLEGAMDTSILEETLGVAAYGSGELDLPEASNAVAAAEVVAAVRGHSAKLTPEAEEYVKRLSIPPYPELTLLAIKALDRVGTDSELALLWEESDGNDEWRAAIADLKRRLSL